MTVADTDVLIDFLAGVGPAVESVAAELGRDSLRTSLIAGIVLQHGATLLTRNRRPFERVAGLRLTALQEPA